MTLLSIIVYCAALIVINGQDSPTELLLVNVIFRHGARTTYSFYHNDPNKNETFYPMGYGGLTNEGKRGEYQLGTFLRNQYGDFLGDVYTEDEVFVRSTDVTRTKMSALLVLAGLYPPNEIQEWNQNLHWQPIPVEYKSDAEEDLFHPTGNCPYKVNVLRNLPNNLDAAAEFITPYLDFFQLVAKYSGNAINTLADLQDIYFIFKIETDMKLQIPDWLPTVYPNPIQDIVPYVYGYQNFDQKTKQINSGYMLKKILDDSRSSMEGSNKKRIYLYSGHETTVGYMLDALKVFKPKVPPYSSAILFELHRSKTDSQHYIKLRYRDDTDATDAVDLQIPGCDVMCPFDQFLELQRDLLPTVSIQEACKE